MVYLTSNDLKTVKKFLFSARKKWYNIGLELGLKADKLDEIQDNCGKNYDEGLLRMLQIWLKSFPDRPTWDQLAKALTDEAIDEAELAERARKKAEGAEAAGGGGGGGTPDAGQGAASEDATAGVPNLEELMNLNIITKVSSQWKNIGIRTGQADNLDTYEKQAMLDNQVCCQKVFHAWINNGGHPKYPLSWKGLYDLLCDVDHRGAANQMADKKGLRR